MEDEVGEIISLCSSIRQVKSQYQITGKHEPKSKRGDSLMDTRSVLNNVPSLLSVDIYTEDDMFNHKLHRYLDIMLSLSMLRQGQIMRTKSDFENIQHIVKSQATDKFTFGSLLKY